MSSNPVYNHRPIQPLGTRSNTAQEPNRLTSTFSIVDSLDAIKQEYDAVNKDLHNIRTQRDDLVVKLESQVAELNSIRTSLSDLEAQQGRIRQQHEEEIIRLRIELHAARISGTPLLSLGIPGRSPRGPGVPEQSPAIPDPPPKRTRERTLSILERDARDREHAERLRDNQDSERDQDRYNDQHREPKRHKTRRDYAESHIPSVGSGSHLEIKASSSHASQSSSPGIYRHSFDGQGSSAALPPMNLSPPVQPAGTMADELQQHNLPSDCRKDGGDWCAIYNPQVKKALDVNLVHTFVHATVVCCVQFSADGRYLATGCNRTAQIFDVHVIADESASKTSDLYIRSVRFSPDGKLLATGAEDRKIRIWDIAKRRILHVFAGHQQEIYSLDFSRDGRYIVSGSGDNTMRIWDMSDKSCKVIPVVEADSLNQDAGLTSVSISPDGTMVAAGSIDTIIRIWDITSGALLERLRGHTDSVYSVTFTPDGRGLVSGSLDKSLKSWDVGSLVDSLARNKQDPANRSVSVPIASTHNFVGHKDFVLSASVTTDSKWVISGSKDRCVHFWDARTAALQFVLQGHKNSVISLDINPLGGMMVTGSGDNTARICAFWFLFVVLRLTIGFRDIFLDLNPPPTVTLWIHT
ncbi:WD40-repeat-containing domain protein [Crassisporium funariophilum]|nr:WD40-repeat-containing domain protein [Crassisporium funariophilum]